MKIRISLAIFIFAIELLLLRETSAASITDNHEHTRYVNNLPVQYKKSYDALKEIEKDEIDKKENVFIPAPADKAEKENKNENEKLKKNDHMKEDDIKEDDMAEDDMKDNDENGIKEDDMDYDDKKDNEMKEDEIASVKPEKNVISAIGTDMSNLAVLAPADTNILKKAGINSHHIIGYVPVNSPNGHALVFPAGAVRILGQQQQRYSLNPVHKKKKIFLRKQEEDENAEEEERGLRKRKRVRRRNTKGKLNRRRSHRGSNKRKRKRKRKGNNKEKEGYRNQYIKNRNRNSGKKNRNRQRSGNDGFRRYNSNSQSKRRTHRIPSYHDY